MARPTKKGLDYFPLDVNLLGDRKFRRCKMKFGCVALVVYIELLSIAYRDNGYYVDYRKNSKDDVVWEIQSVMQGKYQPDTSTIEDIIAELAACGLFDGDRFNNGLITSKRMQRTFLEAVARREKVEINKDIWILSNEETKAVSKNAISISFGVNVDNNSINVNNNSINVDINTQSKVKESKVKESKGEGSKAHAPLTEEQYNALSSEFGEGKVIEYIKRLNDYCKMSGKSYKNPAMVIRKWIIEDKDKPQRGKANKFNNYTDTNKIDYEAYEEQVIKEMLGE